MYNGGPDGVHIGRYCGDQTPSNLSSANSLWIKFNSDNSGTAAGFIAAYTLMHGATLSGKNAKILFKFLLLSFFTFDLFYRRDWCNRISIVSVASL